MDNVVESNKRIAEFMGFTKEKNIGWYDNEMRMSQMVYDKQDGNCFDELLFDEDWNWLMPVVEKIWCITGHRCLFYQEVTKDLTLYGNFPGSCTIIEEVYSLVIEFINWYNKQDG